MVILHNQNNCDSSLIRSEQERGILIMTKITVTEKRMKGFVQMNTEKLDKEFYRERIIEMVEKMENLDFLFKIYHYIRPKYKKEEAGDYQTAL